MMKRSESDASFKRGIVKVFETPELLEPENPTNWAT